MGNRKLKILYKQRQKLLQDIPETFRVVKGSPVKLKRSCGKPNCRCQHGEKHISLYLSQSYKGKTKMTYIPRKYENDIKNCVNNHKRFLRVLNTLSEINIKIIKDNGKI